jgi:hypothetical protein
MFPIYLHVQREESGIQVLSLVIKVESTQGHLMLTISEESCILVEGKGTMKSSLSETQIKISFTKTKVLVQDALL